MKILMPRIISAIIKDKVFDKLKKDALAKSLTKSNIISLILEDYYEYEEDDVEVILDGTGKDKP